MPRIRELYHTYPGYGDVVGDAYGVVYDNPNVPVSGSRHFVYFKKGFVSLYEVSDVGEKGRRSWHAFSHYKRIALPTGSGMQFKFPVYGGYTTAYWTGSIPDPWSLVNGYSYGPSDNPAKGLTDMFSFDAKGELQISPPSNLEDLLADSMYRIMPGVRPYLSTLNSIYELKDFRTIGTTLEHASSMLRWLDNFITSNGKEIARDLRKFTLRELAHRRADDYLQYKFNLAPLYSDIKNTFRALHRWQADVNRLLSQAGKVTRRHTVVMLNEGSGTTEDVDTQFSVINNDLVPAVNYGDGSHSYALNGYSLHKRIVQVQPTKFHVEVELNYSLTQFQVQHAELLGALDALGVNSNPAIIWAAIPWSFVIDWVVGVQRALNNLKRRNLEPVVNIRRCLWSLTRRRTTFSSCKFWVSDPAVPWTPTSEVDETAYHRQTFVPTSASIQSSGLDPSEFSLGVALAISRAGPR